MYLQPKGEQEFDSLTNTCCVSSLGQAGAVDEESFMAGFEDVKRVNIYSGRALSEEIAKIRETLSKSSNDWKVRIDSLQMLRSLLLAGAANYEEMTQGLRTLDVPFQVSVKDLRSQVRNVKAGFRRSENSKFNSPFFFV